MAWIILLAPCLAAQTTVTIGSGVSSGYNAPVYISSATSSNRYSQCIMLFTHQEIGVTGNITTISWHKANANGYTGGNATLNIYMKKTNDISIPTTGGTFANELQGAVLVYSATDQNLPTQQGWIDLPLQTPFEYDGNQNLLVLVDWQRPGNASGAVSWFFTSNPGKSVTWAGVGANPASFYNNGSRPNTRLTLADPYPADAGIDAISQPGSIISPGINPISVSLRNFGTDTLFSAQIHWSIDGVLQPSFLWNDTLPPAAADSALLIGTFGFSVGNYQLKAWSALPNGILDSNNANDTLEMNVLCAQSMSGTYTVGPINADFANIGVAVAQLLSSGVSGPVEFLIQPGVYTEQIALAAVPGASQQHRISFRSATQNPADVIIRHNANSAVDNYTFKFNGASFIDLYQLTFRAEDSTYARAIDLSGGSHYNAIVGNVIECEPQAKTSYHSAGIYTTGSEANFNTIAENTVRDAYQGIYLFGLAGAAASQGSIIEKNKLESCYYYGIYCNNQLGLQILYNEINSASSPVFSYSLYVNNGDGVLRIEGNQIEEWGSGTSYGIRLLGCDGSASANGLIINNTVVQKATSPTNAFGLLVENSTYQKVLNNTVILEALVSNTRCAQFKNGNNLVSINNIFANTGGGFSMVLNNFPLVQSDHNVYWTSGGVLALSQGNVVNNLTALQALLSMDIHSLSENPVFVAPQDRIPTNPALDNIGTPLPEVLTDFSGQARDPLSPDPGAYEFSLFSADAGVEAVLAPGVVANSGSQDVYLSFRNYGTDPLLSVKLYVQVDTATPLQYFWTGVLQPQMSVSQLFVGSVTLPSSDCIIKAWTALPNNVPDSNALNDTVRMEVKICDLLSGSYTIGDTASGADFADFESAIAALEGCGIDGNVIIEVEPAYYYAQLSIGEVYKTNDAYSIIFQSATNDPKDVVVAYKPTDPLLDWVLRFRNTEGIQFRGMTVRLENGAPFGKCIVLDGCTDIWLDGNIISSLSGPSDGYQGIWSSNTIDSLITITNNTITGGYTGISLSGLSSASPERGNMIHDNNIGEFTHKGISLQFQSGCSVTGNRIQSSISMEKTGIDVYAVLSTFKLDKNRIHLSGSGENTGVNVRYAAADSLSRGLIANNFITIEQNSAANTCGLSIAALENVDIFHNSIYTESAKGPIIFGGFCASIGLINNIFYNPGNGTAFYAGSIFNLAGALDVMDYNCYFNQGPSLIFAGTDYANLSSWQTASNIDLHSITTDPLFVSPSLLYPSDTTLNDAGAGLPAVFEDIDGKARNPFWPDPGAVEFDPRYNDAGLHSIDSPANPDAPGMHNIIVRIINTGLSNLQSCLVHYQIDSLPVQNYIWSGNLSPFAVSSGITLGAASFSQGISQLKVWTSLPNNAQDEYVLNDTLSTSLVFCDPLAGQYSLGAPGSGSDFTSFQQAISQLMSCGLSDTVFIKVLPGSYNEQLSIGPIPGASQAKPLIISSSTGNASDVLLHFSPQSIQSNYVLAFDGADFVCVRDISIKVDSASAYGKAVVFKGTASDNCLINNKIQTLPIQSNQFIGIASEGSNADRSLILNNVIEGGMSAIQWLGQSNALKTSECIIQDNVISGFVTAGIQANYQENLEVLSNTITTYSTANECKGISLSYTSSPRLEGNRIILEGSGAQCPLDIANSYGSNSSYGFIVNNIAAQTTTLAGDGSALQLYKASHLNVYYNTFLVSSQYSSAVFRVSGVVDSLRIIDNQFIHNEGGYALMLEKTAYLGGIVESDHNNYFSNGNKLFYAGTPISVLMHWQTISGLDANSLSHNPMMQGNGFTPSSNALDNKGTPISGILNDINGDVRHPLHPDIGAVEFDPPVTDVSLQSIAVLSGQCDLALEAVALEVVNLGQYTIAASSIQWYYSMSGNPMITSGIIADSILPFDTLHYLLPDSMNLSTSHDTIFRLKVWLDLSGDMQPMNDSLEKRVVSLLTPAPPLVLNDTVNYGDSIHISVENPSPASQYQWYQSPAGTPFATGSGITVMPSYRDTVFYVSASALIEELWTIGPADPLFASFQSDDDLGIFLEFDVMDPMGLFIDSLDLYPTYGPGTAYQIVILSDTAPLCTIGVTSTVAAFDRESVAIGCHIPQGQAYKIGLSQNPGLLVNTTAATYPYDIPLVMSITGNTGAPDHYPWFYNIKVRTQFQACESPLSSDTVFVILPPLQGTPGFDTSICANDTILLNAVGIGGVPPYSYMWTPSAYLSSSNTPQTLAYPPDSISYQVFIADLAGQSFVSTFTLNVLPLPSVSLDLPFDSIDISQPPATLGGGNPFGGSYSGPGVTGNIFDPVAAGLGLHTIMYSWEDSLTSCIGMASDTIRVGNWSGWQERNPNKFTLFPNPGSDLVFLRFEPGLKEASIVITDLTGNLLLSKHLSGENLIRLDVSSLPAGAYLVMLEAKEGRSIKKLVLMNK